MPDQFSALRSIDGNTFFLSEDNKLRWECTRCGREFDSDDPEGELCKSCHKLKQEKDND